MKSDYKNKIKKLKIGIIDLKTNNLFSIIQACKKYDPRNTYLQNVLTRK